MKKLFFLASFLLLFIDYAKSQAGSNAYTNALLNWVVAVNGVMYDKYKDTYTLRRIESGTLKPSNGLLYESTERELYTGQDYFIFASTDDRVKNFKLKIFTKNAAGDWDLFKEVDDNNNGLKDVALLGDKESIVVSPTADARYKFEIDATNLVGAGRYTIMLWSKKQNADNTQNNTSATTQATTKTIYTVDSYSVAQYDNTNSKYGDFGKDNIYSGTFEISADETSIRQIESSGAITRYDILQKDVDSDTWIKYTIRSPDGSKYAFYLPKTGAYIRASKLDGNANNPLTDYHIKSKTTE